MASSFLMQQYVLFELSPYQVFYTYNKIKLLFVHLYPCGITTKPQLSHFYRSVRNPHYRLWNWKPSEADSVYCIGSILQYHVKVIQHTFQLFHERPYLASATTCFSMVSQLIDKQLDTTPCNFDSMSFSSLLYSITREMKYLLIFYFKIDLQYPI